MKTSEVLGGSNNKTNKTYKTYKTQLWQVVVVASPIQNLITAQWGTLSKRNSWGNLM